MYLSNSGPCHAILRGFVQVEDKLLVFAQVADMAEQQLQELWLGLVPFCFDVEKGLVDQRLQLTVLISVS